MKKVQYKDEMGAAPFYATPSKYKTSSQIISEARAHIYGDDMAASSSTGTGAPRTLGTQRPFTPREKQRTLFGKAGKVGRPPSAVSLRYLKSQSNDSVSMSNSISKRLQLSPISSSLDEYSFSSKTTSEGSTSSAGSDIKSKLIKSRKAKSLQSELEMLTELPKMKLPSLNCLSKPLHQRNTKTSSFLLQSLSEEKEDVTSYEKSTFSPLTSSKSSESVTKNINNWSENDTMANHMFINDESDDDQEVVTFEVFNKRRLFGDLQSKSEEMQANSQALPEIPTVKKSVQYKLQEEVENSGNNLITNENDKTSKPVDSNETKSLVKLAVQVPSPDIRTEYLNNISEENIEHIHSAKKPSKNYLETLNKNNIEDNEILTNLTNLHKALVEENHNGSDVNGSEKVSILKTLYKYVESPNERILMEIAKIILYLRVTGSNLSGVCKLIFKVARNDKNDHLFTSGSTLELFMEGLGRAEPLSDAECLVYGYGALKFLGMSNLLLTKLRQLGALQLMTLHLKMFNLTKAEDSKTVGEQSCHALYQLTGAMRNMASEDGNLNITNNVYLNEFITTGAMTELCRTMKLFPDDLDVETNVSRTISVLSADYNCCEELCREKDILPGFIHLLSKYKEKAALVVRLTYILGNMVACDDDTRIKLYEENGAVDVMLDILDLYLERCWPGNERDKSETIIIGSDLDGSSGSDEDVMVKTIRVLANMCINPKVGLFFAANCESKSQWGSRLMYWLLSCLRRHAPSDNTELASSALATLNNLTFYHSGDEQISCNEYQLDLCEILCRFLMLDSGPCLTETVRVLGNMSRAPLTKDYMVDTGAIFNISKLLENENEEVSYAAAGVLVNMAADMKGREAWLEANGIRSASNMLLKITEESKHPNWYLARLLCQALWNAYPLPAEDEALLSPLLLNILDEQHVFNGLEELTHEHIIDDDFLLQHAAWEEFAVVAVNLLEKIDPAIDSPPIIEESQYVLNV